MTDSRGIATSVIIAIIIAVTLSAGLGYFCLQAQKQWAQEHPSEGPYLPENRPPTGPIRPEQRTEGEKSTGWFKTGLEDDIVLSAAGFKNSESMDDWFVSGQSADLTLGPLGLEESGGPSFLNHPMGVATDGERLFVADTCNNRVLIWNRIPVSNYAPADIVLGQPDFNSSASRRGKNGLNWPISVATDGKRLFVADTGNNRILIWNTIPTNNFAPADVVVGREDFESVEEVPGVDQTRNLFCWPWGVWSDGTRLFVADTTFGRVMIWNNIPTQNGQPADVILTKRSEKEPLGTVRGIRSDGTRLIVNCHDGWVYIWKNIPTKDDTFPDFIVQYINAETEPGFDGQRILIAHYHIILVWNSIDDLMDNKPHNIVLGDMSAPLPSRNRMFLPRSIATDGKRLIVAERYGSRVLIWNSFPKENYTPPDVVLGQPDFNTNVFLSRIGVDQVAGISTDGTNLMTAHGLEARIMIWRSMPEKTGQPADVVLGWSDFDPNTRIGGPGQTDGWSVFTDGTRVFAASEPYCKLQIWNTIPTRNGQPPDVEIGRPGEAGRLGLNHPTRVVTDGKRVVVADWGNNRVLIWNTIPQDNETPADLVIGQPDFDSTEPRSGLDGLNEPWSVFTDGKRLYVGQRGLPNRILIWNTFPTKNGQPADIEISGWKSEKWGGISGPWSIFSDGTHLFVTAISGHRVLIWNTIPTHDNQPPDVVLGQPNLETLWGSTSRYGLRAPSDVTFDGVHLWVGEVTWSHRAVRFSIPNPRAVILKPPSDITTSSMKLTWSVATREDFIRYEVHMSTEPGFDLSDKTIIATITDRSNSSITINNLNSNTTYWFKVRTCYADGKYGDSVQRWATTKASMVSGEWMERETDHFKIYYRAGYEQQANSLLEAHENVYEFVTGFIGYAPPTRTEIYLCSTPEEYAEVGNTPPEAKPAVGASAGQWSNGVLSYYNTFSGSGVAHEFVHAVESQLLGFERPTWWKEGLACYLTYKFAGEPGPGGIYPDQISDFTRSILENDPPFKNLSELEGEIALTKFGYEESTSVFLFIEENYGESKIKEIIRAADAVENVHAAFQAVLGVSFQAFEAGWRKCLTRSVVAIAEAKSAVGAAEREGRTHGLHEAKARLSEAQNAFNFGRFGEAWEKASEAYTIAESATHEAAGPSQGAPWIWAGVGIAVAVIVLAFLLTRKRK